MPSLLSVRHLSAHFHVEDQLYKAVDDVSFDIASEETLCLVGESGSGKSITALSVLDLLPYPGTIAGGAIYWQGKKLYESGIDHRKSLRGREVAMIFQEPLTALNPVLTCGEQIAEVLRLQQKTDSRTIRHQCLDLLERVGLNESEKVYSGYPHTLSGGMRQRVMIAIALACKPKLLIADEPTTALDVTVQAQILDVLRDQQKRDGMALLHITHNFGIVAGMADRVAVMYASKLVESGPVRSIFKKPAHPYTSGLLRAIPSLISDEKKLYGIPGQVPRANQYPAGCHFHPRCMHADHMCRSTKPELIHVDDAHQASCFHPHAETSSTATDKI